MPTVRIRPRARLDLGQIWVYIAEDSEAQADAFLARSDAQFQRLARRPRLGRMRDELAPGLRSFPLGRYVIFYLDDSNGVDIVRVLHSARDVTAQFKSTS